MKTTLAVFIFPNKVINFIKNNTDLSPTNEYLNALDEICSKTVTNKHTFFIVNADKISVSFGAAIYKVFLEHNIEHSFFIATI